MPLIRPFKGLRPVPEYALDVAAPPYDVLSTEEARQQAKDKPWSFLHISKPEIDLPEGTDVYDSSVYAKGAGNLARMQDQKILMRDECECYYIYQLQMGDHLQTGLVVTASVVDYDSNRIKKHEFTRPVKEDDRVRQIDALNAQTGPVFLTYRHSDKVDAIVDAAIKNKAMYDITTQDGIRHTLWAVCDDANVNQLSELFDAMDNLYIADGHHRSAAASRVAKIRQEANANHNGDENYNYFLSVVFPDNQMKILDYNRVVTDLNNLSREDFLTRVKENFTMQACDSPVKPETSGEFGMYLSGQWYQLSINPDLVPADNPVARLDVSLLSDNLIAPVLGIDDPRRDKRIDFVGGIRGLGELEKRVDSGEMAVAFSLYPTSMDSLMAVADANEVMPPKSTWFEPKLADGLVSHVLD